jgi:hypothetical protein
MGLVVFAAMGLYLLITIGAVKSAIAYARERGKSTTRWGWGAALVMYLIPFWDLLPTIIADQYNCANSAGFSVYKTVDRWKELNPGVFETLSLAHLPEESRIELDRNEYGYGGRDRKYRMADGTILLARFTPSGTYLNYVEYRGPGGESGYQLNERFRYTRRTLGPDLIKLSREEITVLDIKTNEVMAREVNFRQTTKGKIWSGGENAWKFWFQSYDSCFKSYPQKFPNGGIQKYIDSLRTECTSGKDASHSRNGIGVRCR